MSQSSSKAKKPSSGSTRDNSSKNRSPAKADQDRRPKRAASGEVRPQSPPRKQTPHPRSGQHEEEDSNAPPPSGCFACFGGSSKPKSKSKSQAQLKVETPALPHPPPTQPQSAPAKAKVPTSSEAGDKREPSLQRMTSSEKVAMPPVKSSAFSPARPDQKKSIIVDASSAVESKISISSRPLPSNLNGDILSRHSRNSPKDNGGGSNGSNSPHSFKNDSEVDSFPMSAMSRNADVRRSVPRLPLKTSSLEVTSTSAASNGGGFAESNKMLDACGVRFDRSQFSGASDSVANFGDLHLAKLEDACKQLLQKAHPTSRHRLCRSGSSISSSGALNVNGQGIPHSNTLGSSIAPNASSILSLSMSQTLPAQGSFPAPTPPGLTFPAVPPVPSAKFVAMSITLTEILQLQSRPKEAVAVLSRAIDEVNTDMSTMRARKQAAKKPFSAVIVKVHSNNTYDVDYDDGEQETHVGRSSIICEGALKLGAKVKVGDAKNSPSVEEYEQLRKLKAACHRRIGSLYVSYGKYKEAEDHVLKYMSYLEKLPASNGKLNEIAYTCSVLACIYDQLGRLEEAARMDYRAIEEATNARKSAEHS